MDIHNFNEYDYKQCILKKANQNDNFDRCNKCK